MSNETLAIILTALPPTLAALAGLVVGILNSRKSSEIRMVVNGNLRATKDALKEAIILIEELRKAAK